MSKKIFVLTIIIISIFHAILAVPVLTGYYAYLKESGRSAIDICSQGLYTFIVATDYKIYKWNYATNQFNFFQGPQNWVGFWTDFNVRSIACTDTGVL